MNSDHRFFCELKLLGEKKCTEKYFTDNGHSEFGDIIGHNVLLHENEIWANSPDRTKDESFEHYLMNVVDGYLRSEKHNRELKQLRLLQQGVSFLQLFVQLNWTGPPVAEDLQTLAAELLKQPCVKYFGEDSEHVLELQKIVMGDLFHESFHSNMKFPEFLWIAKTLLLSCNHLLDRCSTAAWWALRCVYILQQTLEEQSSSLCELAKKFSEAGLMVEPLMTADDYRHLQVQFHLEASHILNIYYQFSKSKEHFQTAQKLCSLTTAFTGVLGKRTHFQTDDKSQLVLKVQRGDELLSGDVLIQPFSELPQDVKLNDGVLLDNISFKEEAESCIIDLHPEEQAFLLNAFFQMRRCSAIDELTREELLTYLTTILRHPKNWAIQTSTLFCRSVMEHKTSRTVERSMMQLEALVSNFRSSQPSFAQRSQLFYSVALPSLYQIEIELANVLKSLGVIKSALDVYLRLEKWNSVIECYQVLGRKEQAQQLIRQRLAIKETPTLWCWLALATDDIDAYTKAWELSGHRSAPSRKGLGDYYFARKKYSECIPYYQKSLELNNLQVGVWSALAYAAMQVEDWQLTARAYRQALTLEPDNFLAWNNLSNAYIKMNQKSRAWKTLQEALKCNYDDWKIWENYLIVSTDCAAFEDIVNAYNRILDLKEKHVDVEVLSILVRAVVENLSDNEGNSARRLLPRCLQLFGRLTSQVTSNSKLWLLYSELTAVGGEELSVKEKSLQYMHKAHRCAVAQRGWEKDQHQCKEVVDLSLRLVEAYLALSNDLEGEHKDRHLSSARLSLTGVIGRLDVYQNSLIQPSDEVQSLTTQLQNKLVMLDQIVNKVS